MPATKRSSYRLPEHTLATVRAIAEIREGLSQTQVIVNAVERYGRSVLGRRMADLVPPRARPDRATPGDGRKARP